MRLERIENTKRNIWSGTVNKIILILFPFIARTILVKELSEAFLGLNGLCNSILQVLNMAELGFNSAIVYSMYKPIANNDIDTICILMNFYKHIYRLIGIIILFIGTITAFFLPIFIKSGVPRDVNIYFVYSIYLINTVLTYFLFAYKSALLSAYQRLDIASNLSSVTQGLMYIFQIGALVLFHQYYIFILLMPLFTIINNIANAVIVNRKYPLGKIDQGMRNGIMKQTLGLFLYKVCQKTRSSFDAIFVSFFMGLTFSAIYSNYNYIVLAICSVMFVVSTGIVAGVGNSVEIDSVEKNYQDFKKLNFLYMFVASICVVCLLCLYQPFMALWSEWMGGKTSLFELDTVIMFCVLFYTLQMGVIKGVYSEAKGLWWESRYPSIFESLCNLILNYFLGKTWGINGIIVATIISLVCINFGIGSQIIFRYYFGKEYLNYFYFTHFYYTAVTIVVACLVWIITAYVRAVNIGEICLKGFLCALLSALMFGFVYSVKKEYRDNLKWLINSLLHRSV